MYIEFFRNDLELKHNCRLRKNDTTSYHTLKHYKKVLEPIFIKFEL